MDSLSRDGEHRLLFFTGRDKSEIVVGEGGDDESLVKESEKYDDIVQVKTQLREFLLNESHFVSISTNLR